MSDPAILYSTNTWLAYVIAERFYKGLHYVWCTPYFDEKSIARGYDPVPPTSNPSWLYRQLSEAVKSGDRHLAKIESNKSSIRKGAVYKRDRGVIDDDQLKDIMAIVEQSRIGDFRPLLYVISFDRLKGKYTEVSVEKRAHPLSVEYIIESLPHECFDVIEFDWS